ncbi:14709_t:CDS:10 [Entrophospora sp. SA101]|nr:14709_t:CDS:10 [Entrophospora sp. SA101]
MSKNSEQDLRGNGDYIKEKYSLFEGSGEEYEVDEILDMRTKYGEKYYLIKWAGYNDLTWEPEHHLHCQQRLEIFLNKLGHIYNPKTKENTSFTTNNDKPLAKKQKLVKLIKPPIITTPNCKQLARHLPHNNYTSTDRRNIDELCSLQTTNYFLNNSQATNTFLNSPQALYVPQDDLQATNAFLNSPQALYVPQNDLQTTNTFLNSPQASYVPQNDLQTTNSFLNNSQATNTFLDSPQVPHVSQNNLQTTYSFLNNPQETVSVLNSSQATKTFLNNPQAIYVPQSNLHAANFFLNNSQATISFLNSSQTTNLFLNSSQPPNVPQSNPLSPKLNKSSNNLEIVEQKESNELSSMTSSFQGKWTGGLYKMVRSQKTPAYISRIHIDAWPRITPDLELFDALKSLDKITLQYLHPLDYVFSVFNQLGENSSTFVSMVFVSSDHATIERERTMHKWSERASFTIFNDWVLYFLPNSGNINQMLHIPRVECSFILLRVNTNFFTKFQNEVITISSDFTNDKDFKDYKTYVGAGMSRVLKLPENLYKIFSKSNYCLLTPPGQPESFDMECYMKYIGANVTNLKDRNLNLILVHPLFINNLPFIDNIIKLKNQASLKFFMIPSFTDKEICPQEILISGGIIMPTLKALTEISSLAHLLKEYVDGHTNWVVKIHPYIIQSILKTFDLLNHTDKSSAKRLFNNYKGILDGLNEGYIKYLLPVELYSVSMINEKGNCYYSMGRMQLIYYKKYRHFIVIDEFKPQSEDKIIMPGFQILLISLY